MQNTDMGPPYVTHLQPITCSWYLYSWEWNPVLWRAGLLECHKRMVSPYIPPIQCLPTAKASHWYKICTLHKEKSHRSK